MEKAKVKTKAKAEAKAKGFYAGRLLAAYLLGLSEIE